MRLLDSQYSICFLDGPLASARAPALPHLAEGGLDRARIASRIAEGGARNTRAKSCTKVGESRHIRGLGDGELDIAFKVRRNEIGEPGCSQAGSGKSRRDAAAGRGHNGHAHPQGVERCHAAAVWESVERHVDFVVT